MSRLVTIAALLLAGRAHAVSQETINATLANLPEDATLNFTQLAAKYGYPATEHDVTTADGYILRLFNIPGDKTRPVLLCHGVFDTADGWLLRALRSLALSLAAARYDVWLLNVRGNRYSRRHVSLDPDTDPQFWQYSLDELAAHDLKSNIDYVLNETKQKSLSLIAFSQGTTMSFMLLSSQPAYNAKIKVFMALAPIVYLDKVRQLLAVIIKFSPFINWILPPNLVELSGYYSLTKALMNFACTQTILGYDLCYEGAYNSVAGWNSPGIERAFFPVPMGHFPAGASRKSLLHFSQISLRNTVAKYDYGTAENLKRYISFTPPVYDLSKVSAPVELLCGKNDAVSTLDDVNKLVGKLSNVTLRVAASPTFNHLDHLWASDAYEQEYEYILDRLKIYNR